MDTNNQIIFILGFLLNLLLTVKAKTKLTKEFGKSLLLYRLTTLIPLMLLFTALTFNFYIDWRYIVVGLGVASFLYYILRKSKLFLYYAIMILALTLFGGSVVWVATLVQIYLFVKDLHKPNKL